MKFLSSHGFRTLPTISPHDVQLDRPLFEEINLSIHTYMKRIDRPYTINEAYMFYDFLFHA